MFKTTCKIAWASLRRRPTRSMLLVLMIAISLWGLLLMEGVYDGMYEQMISNAIRSDSGHITMLGEGYRLDPDLSRWIMDVDKVESFIAKDTRVKSYAMRLKQDGLVATAHYSRGANIIGVDLEAENENGRLAGYLEDGEYGFGSKGKGALIGFKLAEKLQVRVGSKIIVSAQDSGKDVSSMPLRITGIIKTNNMALDGNAVILGEKRMRKLVGMESGFSQIAVIAHDELLVPGLQQDLADVDTGVQVLRWDEMYPALLQSREMMKTFNLVTNLLIFCVAALGIFGVLLVSILERLREFGVMRAIGTHFGEIRNIIFAESFFMAAMGFGLGAMVGFASLYYFKVHGLDLTIFGEAFEAFGMDAVTYAIIRPDYFFTALLAVTGATFLSVIIPLRILKKSKPIETINSI